MVNRPAVGGGLRVTTVPTCGGTAPKTELQASPEMVKLFSRGVRWHETGSFGEKGADVYTINDKIKGPVMGLRIQGAVTDRETRRLKDHIEARSARWGPLRILVVLDTYPNFNSAEALCEDLRFAKLTAAHLDRVAVVGAEPWKDTWVGLFGLFGGLKMAYYQTSAIDAAWQWLTAEALA